MTYKSTLHVLSIALILVATIGCSRRQQPTPAQTSQPEVIVEDFAPDKLGQYLGQVVVLNFWAIWCAPCRSELPALEAIHREYREQGVVVLGVNVSESSADIIAFARKYQLTFPLLRDHEQKAMKANDIRALPTTLFIGRQGQIQYRKLGAMSEGFIKQQVEALLE